MDAKQADSCCGRSVRARSGQVISFARIAHVRLPADGFHWHMGQPAGTCFRRQAERLTGTGPAIGLRGWSRSCLLARLCRQRSSSFPGRLSLPLGGPGPAEVAEPPLRHRFGDPRGAVDAANRLVHAGANAKDIKHAGKGENSQHLRLRCDQQELAPGDSGLLTPVHQRRHATGIHERQARQIDDDLPLTGRDRRKRSSDTYRVCYIKHPAQHDDNLTIAFTGTHIYEGHSHAFLLQQQRRDPDPAAKFADFNEYYAQYSLLSPLGSSEPRLAWHAGAGERRRRYWPVTVADNGPGIRRTAPQDGIIYLVLPCSSRSRSLPKQAAGDTVHMVNDTARDQAIYHALKAADEVAAALQAHLIEEHGADPERAAPHSPSSNSLKLLRQARERLGNGLRAIHADDIAESDEISLRNH